MSLVRSLITSALRPWIPQVNSVRHRYYESKVKKGPLVRRMDYYEDIEHRGLLAHTGPSKRIAQMKTYRPGDPWEEKKALFGQNDYVDILGTENIHPTTIMYNVPIWLRGIAGNEYQILLRKRKIWGKGNSRFYLSKMLL